MSRTSTPKILVIPARRHILESYTEYIIQHLSDEFYFDMGYPGTGVMEFNPDNYDLIWPHFDSHWHLNAPEKYTHKIATVMIEPGGPRFKTAVIGATSKPCEEALNNKCHSLRFGVDSFLYFPFDMVRTDNLLHVGFLGNIQTPRRYMKELFMPLKDLEGVRLMIFPTTWSPNTRPDEIERMGGKDMTDRIVRGDVWLNGLPNLYNQMDVYVRCDINHGEQLSVMEAASCGVPVVCTDSGNTKLLCDAGGGICVGDPKGNWEESNLKKYAQKIREAVIELRDNPGKRIKMGKKARLFIEASWTWDKFIPAWREFFREGVKNVRKEM